MGEGGIDDNLNVVAKDFESKHGYVDAMDKMILKEVMASPHNSLQQKKQTILKVVAGPSETLDSSSSSKQSTTPTLPPPPPYSSSSVKKTKISFADDIIVPVFQQPPSPVLDGASGGNTSAATLSSEQEDEEEVEEEVESSSSSSSVALPRSVDLFLRPDAHFMDVAMRPRARSKRFSRNTLINFMKVMRRGVLPKVLVGELVDAAVGIEPSVTSLLSSIAAK